MKSIFYWITDFREVLDRGHEIFILLLVGFIFFAVAATLIMNRWAKKHGFPNGK